jgi:hypothetical protein
MHVASIRKRPDASTPASALHQTLMLQALVNVGGHPDQGSGSGVTDPELPHDQAQAGHTDHASSESRFDHAQTFQSVPHFHSEQGSILSVNAEQPLPLIVGQVCPINHSTSLPARLSETSDSISESNDSGERLSSRTGGYAPTFQNSLGAGVGAIRDVLTMAVGPLDHHHVAGLYVASTRLMRDPDGVHSHAVMTLYARLVELA